MAVTTLTRIRPHVEVAVIGGGPAGSTVARLLAEAGRDVVLFTGPAHPWPRQAESLPPASRALIDRLDLRGRFARAGFMRAAGRMIWWDDGEPRIERRAARTRGGWHLPRAAFDDLLLSFADARRVRVVPDAIVRDVDLSEPYRAIVHCAQGDQAAAIRARCVIDCSGRAGLIATRWRRHEPSQRALTRAGVWKAVFGWPLPDPAVTLIEAFDEGCAWSIPLSPIERMFCAMGARDDTRDGARDAVHDGARGYAAAIDRTRHLRSLLPHARAHRLPWAADASLYHAVRYADSNALLCGDAASTIDPLAASGLHKALASAWLAAIVVDTSLTRPALAGAARALYEAREREMYGTALAESVRQARAALAAFPDSRFWRRRAETPLDGRLMPSIEERCRDDARVRAAIERLRGVEAAQLQADIVRLAPRVLIERDAIVLADAMVLPIVGDTTRFFGGVNLPAVVSLVRETPRDVPALFEAYQRAEAAVDHGLFVTALAVLVSNQALKIVPVP